MAELTFETRTVTGGGQQVTVAEVGGAIDQTTVRGFDEKLNTLIEQGCRCLILNFREVKYINSTGMGLMVKVSDRFTEAGGNLLLAEVSQKIKDLFDMLGLLALFVIHDSTQAALDAMARNGGGEVEAQPLEAVEAVEAVEAEPVEDELPEVSEFEMEDFELDDIAVGGDVQVAAEPVVAEPVRAARVEFPFDTACGYCEGLLEVPAAGDYKCPRCEAYFTVEQDGKIESYRDAHPSVVEVKVPASAQFLRQLVEMAGAYAEARQYPPAFVRELRDVVDTICQIISQKSSGHDIVQLVLVGNAQEVVIGFKASTTAFRDGNQGGDPRLRNIANKVDRMELFALSSRGEMLKLVKRRS